MRNTDAFNLVHDSHQVHWNYLKQAYYDNKRSIIFDSHFNETESYLLNDFKAAIDARIDYSKNANLTHVDDFDKSSLKDIPLVNVPFISREAVKTSINYDDLNNNANVKVSATDPYHEIYPNRT